MNLWNTLRELLTKPGQQPGTVPGVPSFGVSVTIPLPSGCNVAQDRFANMAKLRMAGLAAINNPLWRPGQPLPGDTHCNGAAQQIANAMGCRDLDYLMADQQIMKMRTAPGWRMDTAERAVAHAAAGGLAFATVYGIPHGHLAALQPEPMQFSQTWSVIVPLIYNVGHENKPCKLSGGFLLAQRPMIQFYLWGTV